MTTGTPAAPARFALPAYERPMGEQAANLADPVLRAIADPARRATLVAVAQPGPAGGPGALRFDIRLQGDHETVFLDV